MKKRPSAPVFMRSPRREIVWHKTKGLCAYCQCSLTPDLMRQTRGLSVGMVVEHANPRALGGENRLPNLLPSCGPCNARKAARGVAAFLDAERVRRGRPDFTFHPVAMELLLGTPS